MSQELAISVKGICPITGGLLVNIDDVRAVIQSYKNQVDTIELEICRPKAMTTSDREDKADKEKAAVCEDLLISCLAHLEGGHLSSIRHNSYLHRSIKRLVDSL